MANCALNTGITILNGSALTKNIKFSSNWQEILLNDTSTGTAICNNAINSNDFFGISIVNNELVFSAAISGLSTNINSPTSAIPRVSISNSSGVLAVIGMDDVGMGFAVSRVNVRFDAATSSVKFQI